MPADVETMGYRNHDEHSRPWHGLGFAIDHDASPEEMLKISGLDWTVSKRPLFTHQEPTPQSDAIPSLAVNDYFALVRDSDNKILGPAGKEYIPIQNRRAFEFFKKFAEAGRMKMETAGSLQGGKQVWVLAKIERMFALPGGDEVWGFLLLSSPHIWGKSFIIKFTTVRVVCMNTFMQGMNDSTYGKGFRMPHIRPFDDEVIKEAKISLGIANELFESFESVARKLATAKVDGEVIVRYVADILQPEMIVEKFGKGFYRQTEAKQASELMAAEAPKLNASQFKRSAYDAFNQVNRQPGADLESTKGTLWGGFNAITYYIDHIAGRDRDNAIYSSWFGPKSVVKAKALRRAVQIAEILK